MFNQPFKYIAALFSHKCDAVLIKTSQFHKLSVCACVKGAGWSSG